MLDMEKEILFETKRLIVREILEKDAEKLAEMASDGSWQEVGLDAECRSWIKDWIWEAKALSKTNDPRKDYLAYVCVLKESMEVIGLVGCSYYQDLKEVGITYCVGSAYRNKGYAQEAAKDKFAYKGAQKTSSKEKKSAPAPVVEETPAPAAGGMGGGMGGMY